MDPNLKTFLAFNVLLLRLTGKTNKLRLTLSLYYSFPPLCLRKGGVKLEFPSKLYVLVPKMLGQYHILHVQYMHLLLRLKCFNTANFRMKNRHWNCVDSALPCRKAVRSSTQYRPKSFFRESQLHLSDFMDSIRFITGEQAKVGSCKE